MPTTLIGMDLATKLTQATEAKGWSQGDFTRALNEHLDEPVSKYVVNAWYTGKRRPDAALALVASRVLGLDLVYLCDDQLDEPPPRPDLTEDERMVLRMFRASGLDAEEAVKRILVKDPGPRPR